MEGVKKLQRTEDSTEYFKVKRHLKTRPRKPTI